MAAIVPEDGVKGGGLECRAEGEERQQRFSMVHVSFSKKEAALQARLERADGDLATLRSQNADLQQVGLPASLGSLGTWWISSSPHGTLIIRSLVL